MSGECARKTSQIIQILPIRETVQYVGDFPFRCINASAVKKSFHSVSLANGKAASVNTQRRERDKKSVLTLYHLSSPVFAMVRSL